MGKDSNNSFGLPVVQCGTATLEDAWHGLEKLGETLNQKVKQRAKQTDTNPTEAQKESGRYKKGRISLHGLPIAIENPAGSVRSGTSEDGETWETKMHHHYGYVERTDAADDDPVDVFIGTKPESELVVIVNQVDPKTKEFDEHKVMLGFVDTKAAKKAYLANYEKGWKGLGSTSTITMEQFKWWLEHADHSKAVENGAFAKHPRKPARPQLVARITISSKQIISMPGLPKMAEAADLPYRDRTEMFALTPGGRLLSGLYPDTSIGVFGGGIDPGEEAAIAAARETREEAGRRVHDPQLLPVKAFTQDFPVPYSTDKQRERAKSFRGSRTQYITGELGRRVPGDVEESGLSDIKLRTLSEAIKLQDAALELARATGDEAAIARLERRQEVLLYLLAQREKEAADEEDYETESATIRENQKGKGAKAHKFVRAKYLYPNMHPRCLWCGDEESVDGQCPGHQEKEAADRTVPAYKQFRTLLSRPDELLPLFIDNQKAVPQDEWVEAENIPTEGFAPRPGWHAGALPSAPHLRSKEDRIQPGRVWAEVELPDDVDWQSKADESPTKDIRDEVPEGGHYRKKTPQMQGGEWLIGGKLKVRRVLSDDQVSEILRAVGEHDAAEKERQKAAESEDRQPTVAVDLDGTLAKHFDEYDPDSIPDPRPGARKAMEEFQRLGHRIIIFTVRGDKQLVRDWLHEHEIPYDYINENPDQPEDASDKILADVYIDDRGVDGRKGWRTIQQEVGKRIKK
jgi:8-oxo-dGTP pyrophosphatase MutT (NUDIX family)